MKKAIFEGKPTKFCTFAEAPDIYRLGKNTIRREAEEAGAVIEVGRRRLIDMEKMDKHLRSK